VNASVRSLSRTRRPHTRIPTTLALIACSSCGFVNDPGNVQCVSCDKVLTTSQVSLDNAQTSASLCRWCAPEDDEVCEVHEQYVRDSSVRCNGVLIGALNARDMTGLLGEFIRESAGEMYIMSPFVEEVRLSVIINRARCAHIHLCTRREGRHAVLNAMKQGHIDLTNKQLRLYSSSTFHFKLLAKTTRTSHLQVLLTTANLSAAHLSVDDGYNYDGFAWFCTTMDDFKRRFWNAVSPNAEQQF
jgi:hypothetical protein